MSTLKLTRADNVRLAGCLVAHWNVFLIDVKSQEVLIIDLILNESDAIGVTLNI